MHLLMRQVYQSQRGFTSAYGSSTLTPGCPENKAEEKDQEEQWLAPQALAGSSGMLPQGHV